MVIVNHLLIITSTWDQKVVSLDTKKKHESQEVSLQLADHELQEVSVV